MKKLVFSAICCLITLMAVAQSKVGVQASGIMSSASFTDDNISGTNRDARAGFGAGVFAEYPLSGKFTIKPGLNFMQKGVNFKSRYVEDNTKVTQRINTRLNYLEVPVLAIYNVKGSQGKWFIGAGPSASYGLSGRLKGEIEIVEGNSSSKEPINIDAFKDENHDGADFRRFDFGLAATAGHNINKNLSVQINYLHGLSNIASNSDVENRFKNRNAMLALKYRI